MFSARRILCQPELDSTGNRILTAFSVLKPENRCLQLSRNDEERDGDTMKLQVVDPVWPDRDVSSINVTVPGPEPDSRQKKDHDDVSSPTATTDGTRERGGSWLLRRRPTLKLGIMNKFRGWREALLLLCILSWALTLSILGISIALSTRGGITDASITTVTIQSGSCDDINSADMWIHLVMNILSSSLLAATVSFALSPCRFLY